MKFLKIPHLPEGVVTHVLIDKYAYDETFDILHNLKIETVLVEKCQDVMDAISSHPDIFYFHFGGNKMVVAPNADVNTRDILKKIGFEIYVGKSILKRNYPYDVAYNIARLGDYVVHNFRCTDEVALTLIEGEKLKKINVLQGYTKCSILIVDKNAIITSDRGIAKFLLQHDFDVLLIKEGYIELTGLNYGFIGGCGGFVLKNLFLFNGDITKHPNYSDIKNFFNKYNKEIIYINNKPLKDIGSIIPLCEK